MLLYWRCQIKDTIQLQVTRLFHVQGMQQSFCYLIDHVLRTLLRKLHEAVFDDVVNKQVNVSSYTLLIGQLLDSLLNEVRLSVHKVPYVLYRLWI